MSDHAVNQQARRSSIISTNKEILSESRVWKKFHIFLANCLKKVAKNGNFWNLKSFHTLSVRRNSRDLPVIMTENVPVIENTEEKEGI